MLPSRRVSGELHRTLYDQELIIKFECWLSGAWDSWIRLSYDIVDFWTGEEHHIEDKICLVSTRPPYGGRRWWFICPRSDRRVRVLQGAVVRHVGDRFNFDDNLVVMDAYTVADAYAFVDIYGRDLGWSGVDKTRVTFRVRNLADRKYAQWGDPGYPDQIMLGAPRSYEVSAAFKF